MNVGCVIVRGFRERRSTRPGDRGIRSLSPLNPGIYHRRVPLSFLATEPSGLRDLCICRTVYNFRGCAPMPTNEGKPSGNEDHRESKGLGVTKHEGFGAPTLVGRSFVPAGLGIPSRLVPGVSPLAIFRRPKGCGAQAAGAASGAGPARHAGACDGGANVVQTNMYIPRGSENGRSPSPRCPGLVLCV